MNNVHFIILTDKWVPEQVKVSVVSCLCATLMLLLVPLMCVKFKTLMLAYRTATGSAPSYFHSLMTIYIPSRSLRSASERRLMVPSHRDTKSLSRTFSFTVPGWWNELPTSIRNAVPDNFHATPENASLPFSLDFYSFFFIKKQNLCSLSLTSSCLASFALNDA